MYRSDTSVNHDGHEYDVEYFLDLVAKEGWELVTAVPVDAVRALTTSRPTTFTTPCKQAETVQRVVSHARRVRIVKTEARGRLMMQMLPRLRVEPAAHG